MSSPDERVSATVDTPRFQLIALPYEDSDQRCRCGKRKVVDVGFGVDGEHQGYHWCLDCDVLMPETSWALEGVERPYRIRVT